MRILLELDPNVVKPGWTPLLITIAIALVMVLLFRSMRRQFRRVDDNFLEPAAPVGVEPDESPAATGTGTGERSAAAVSGEPATGDLGTDAPAEPDERTTRT